MSLVLKLIYSLNPVPIKITITFFIGINKPILKYIWKGKGTIIAKTVLKKNKNRKTLTGFRSCCKAMVVKNVWYRHKDEHTDQWTKPGAQKIDLHKSIPLVFDNGSKAIQWPRDSWYN